MTESRTHPLAPDPDTNEEGPLETENSTESVNMRSGVELGSMRFVLGISLLLAIIGMVGGYLVVVQTG